ncbi:hypothetical protein [Psychrobacter nivimaris]|uniref:hypothetical protein n=1 Tax=Psychrobacter nivimaris TaxID=281738 RepID=UPI0037369014
MHRELSTRVDNVSRRLTNFDSSENIIFDEASVSYAHSKLLRYVADEYIRDVRLRRKSIESFYTALSKLDDHDAKSLLYVSNFLENKSWENISFDSDDYKNQLIEYLKNQQDPLLAFNELIYQKISNVLPEEYLGWFKNDLRCSLFLTYLIRDSIEYEAYKGRNELINAVTDYLRYEIHMFIDLYFQNLPNYEVQHYRIGERKVVDILYVKSVYLKNRLDCEEDINWIDPTNDQQVNSIYKYLNDKDRQHIILKGIFFPQNTKEKYELILASLDVLSNVEDPNIGTKNKKGFSPRGYTLYIMEKAWRGRKYYSSQKPSSDNDSVKIYDKNLPKLKELMKFSGLTANKMINKSIEQTYDKLILEKIDK